MRNQSPDDIMLKKKGEQCSPLGMSGEEISEILFGDEYKKQAKRNWRLVLGKRDLNNQRAQDISDCNPPKSSFFIGVEGTF